MTCTLRELPILFDGRQVRATLDGLMTETRRLITPRTSLVDGRGIGRRGMFGDPEFWQHLDFGAAWVDRGPSPAGNPGPYLKVPYPPEGSVHRVYPRIEPGDLLYVRETWGTQRWCAVFPREPQHDRTDIIYRAGRLVQSSKNAPQDFDLTNWPETWKDDDVPDDGRWRPSIHMPKWAARLWLRVLEVRAERLHEITEEGAIAEGAPLAGWQHPMKPLGVSMFEDHRAGFACLWDQINGKRSPWARNDWVWVVRFERVDAPRAQLKERSQ